MVSWLTRPGVERRTQTHFVWDISLGCRAPHVREFMARPGAAVQGSQVFHALTYCAGAAHVLHLDMQTPCRSCESCLKRRSSMWRLRALTETARSARTWFGTLTIAPEHRFLFDCLAGQRLAEKGVQFDLLPPEEKFSERHRQVSRELTLWMKRLRKDEGALRFLIVAEAHKSGDPHYHVLVHELDQLRPVRHARLVTHWRLGFQKWNLVQDARQATYLCKYLSKSLSARVRASQAYGGEPPSAEELAAQCARKWLRKNPVRYPGPEEGSTLWWIQKIREAFPELAHGRPSDYQSRSAALGTQREGNDPEPLKPCGGPGEPSPESRSVPVEGVSD